VAQTEVRQDVADYNRVSGNWKGTAEYAPCCDTLVRYLFAASSG